MSTLSVFDAAREAPHRLAVVAGCQSVDFAELAERVRERLPSLAALGAAAPGQPVRSLVALRATEELPTLELIYALLELRQPFLPLHPRLTPDETARLLEQLPVSWSIAAEGRAAWLEARPAGPPSQRDVRWFQQAEQLAALATSGSSGEPHVVLLSRRAFLAAARASAAHLGWHEDDRWLLCLPLAHIGGLSIVTRCLLARRPVVLPDRLPAASLGERLVNAIGKGAPTLVSLVPTQLSALLRVEPAWTMPEAVRAILTGGAAASAPLLRACAERGWPVLTSYGLTEACSQVATQRTDGMHRGGPGVGSVLPGIEVRLKDGLIQIRGPNLLTGYLIGPAQPLDAEGWFTTSDLGRFTADGQLCVLGRADHTIITGGENVAPAEVEAVLEACPGVLEACVFAVPDAHWGHVVAAGLRVQGTDPDGLLREVRSEAERRLAAFKRPRCYALASAFVYGHTGKLDRRATAAALLGQLQGGPAPPEREPRRS